MGATTVPAVDTWRELIFLPNIFALCSFHSTSTDLSFTKFSRGCATTWTVIYTKINDGIVFSCLELKMVSGLPFSTNFKFTCDVSGIQNLKDAKLIQSLRKRPLLHLQHVRSVRFWRIFRIFTKAGIAGPALVWQMQARLAVTLQAIRHSRGEWNCCPSSSQRWRPPTQSLLDSRRNTMTKMPVLSNTRLFYLQAHLIAVWRLFEICKSRR